MKNSNLLSHIILFFAIVLYTSSLLAQSLGLPSAPEKINYQAIARDASGNQLVNQNVSIRFTIRSGSAGGSIAYQETQNLTTNQFGLITTFIGTGTVITGPFSGIGWSSSDKYLQVEIDPAGGTTFTDMGTSQFVSVPYSYLADKALFSYDNAWTHYNTDIYNNNSGNVGIGINAPARKLHVEDNATPDFYGIIYSKNTAPSLLSDAYAIVGISETGDFYGTGGFFQGGWRGVYGTVAPTGNHSYYGVVGDVVGGNGTNSGVYGTSDQTGVYGIAYGIGKGLTEYYGPSFLETAGIHGKSVNNTTLNGISYGVSGEATSNTSHINCGVFGYGANAVAGTSPRNWGVLGVTDDAVGGVGVLAIGDGPASSRGMEADVLRGTTQTALFTYIATNAPANYAGYFNGQIYATNANASIKAFKIDHPLDPANKFLYHSSVESPDMLNIYSGNVVTDANGLAKINLPSYFEVLNKDFSYQLTCIGTFAQAIVAEKVKDNSFSIRTNKPNVEVSWMVTGIRHDPVAELYRIVPEVEKVQSEKGKYLIPEAYGQPKSAAMLLPEIPEKGIVKNEIAIPKNARTK